MLGLTGRQFPVLKNAQCLNPYRKAALPYQIQTALSPMGKARSSLAGPFESVCAGRQTFTDPLQTLTDTPT